MLKGNFNAWLGGHSVGRTRWGGTVYKDEIYDPTTTRMVPAGAIDPVTGLVNTSGADAVIRDPFSGQPDPAGRIQHGHFDSAAILPHSDSTVP